MVLGKKLQGLLELGVHFRIFSLEFLQGSGSHNRLIEFLLEFRDLFPGFCDLFTLRDIDKVDKQACQKDKGSQKDCNPDWHLYFFKSSNNAPVFMSHRSSS